MSSRFELLKKQPEFPVEDLNKTNAEFIGYYLRHEHAEATYADFLRGSLHMLHSTGHRALQLTGIEIDYSEKEYHSFCAGFAAFEYTSLLVNPRRYDGKVAIRKTQELLLAPARLDNLDIVDIEIAARYGAWLKSHPNTYDVIIDTGIENGESLKQLHARGIGAELAYELQTAA